MSSDDGHLYFANLFQTSTELDKQSQENILELLLNHLHVILHGKSTRISPEISSDLLKCWLKIVNPDDILCQRSIEIAVILSKNEDKLDFSTVSNDELSQLVLCIKNQNFSSVRHSCCILIRRILLDSKDNFHSEVGKIFTFCEKTFLPQLSNLETQQDLDQVLNSDNHCLLMLIDSMLIKYPFTFKPHVKHWSEFIFNAYLRSPSPVFAQLLLNFCIAFEQVDVIFDKIFNSIIKMVAFLLDGVHTKFSLLASTSENIFLAESSLGFTFFSERSIFVIQKVLAVLQLRIELLQMFLKHAQLCIECDKVIQLLLVVFSLNSTSISKDSRLPLGTFEIIKQFVIPQLHIIFLRLFSKVLPRLKDSFNFKRFHLSFQFYLVAMLDKTNSMEKQKLLFECVFQLKELFHDVPLELKQTVFENIILAKSWKYFELFLYEEQYEEKIWGILLKEAIESASNELISCIKTFLLNTKNPYVLQRVIPILKNSIIFNDELSVILHVLICPQKNPFQSFYADIPKCDFNVKICENYEMLTDIQQNEVSNTIESKVTNLPKESHSDIPEIMLD